MAKIELMAYDVINGVRTRKFYDRDLVKKINRDKRLCQVFPSDDNNIAPEIMPVRLSDYRRDIADSISFSFEIHSFTKEEYERIQSILFKLGYQWQSNRAYYKYNKIYRKLPCKTMSDGYVTCKIKTVLADNSILIYSPEHHWHYCDHFWEYNALMRFITREFSLGVLENGSIKRLSRPDI